MCSFPLFLSDLFPLQLFVPCAYKIHSEVQHLSHSFSRFQVQGYCQSLSRYCAKLFCTWKLTSIPPKNHTGLFFFFFNKDSFKVWNQTKYIKVESEVTQSREKLHEMVSSGFTNSLSLKRNSHCLWAISISCPLCGFLGPPGSSQLCLHALQRKTS